jgi:3',5'-cyclic AMP phosphodiesterase CpdA
MLHVSDLHFGPPAVPEAVEAIEAHIQAARYDVVVVSGDLTQRARSGEFQRARVFLREAGRVSQVIVVPGNHDVAWWRSPLYVRGSDCIYGPYRRFIGPELEPVLRMPGATLVGINTAQGVSLRTLTWNLRDISIIGDLRREQLEHARAAFAASPLGDLRAVVMHHNPVKGEISRRCGLKHSAWVLEQLVSMGVELLFCGHDHQEAVHYLERTGSGIVVSTAGTVSDRSRGGRPPSVNALRVEREGIEARTLCWSSSEGTLVESASYRFPRRSAVADLSQVRK